MWPKQHYAISIFILLLFALVVQAGPTSFSGKVVGVTDGDTINVMHDGKAEKIRLNGIDCPESHQDFGNKAKQFASGLVFGKVVTVEVKDIDKYGRTVGEVLLSDGRSLNRELVKAGYAWWYKKYSNDNSLGGLEIEARNAKRGLWADPKPIAPWDFRKGKRSDANSGNSNIGVSESLVPENLSQLSERLQPTQLKTVTSDDSLSQRLAPIESSGSTPPSQESLVFITKTGKKYHLDGCSSLSRSKIPVSLTEAKSRNYGPCSKCNPPR